MRNAKPRFPRFALWGACSRCGARVLYSTLRRERLTGLLVCSGASGRPTQPCWDPWPAVFDFQAKSDNSLNPPPEPLPARWMLDDIFSAGTYNSVAAGTPGAYANAPKAAPDDATRIQHFLKLQFQSALKSAFDFTAYRNSLNQNQDNASVIGINPANYDGTFVPSSSVRTVTNPDGSNVDKMNVDQASGDQIIAPQWAIQKGV
jgi:hypothetical protein